MKITSASGESDTGVRTVDGEDEPDNDDNKKENEDD